MNDLTTNIKKLHNVSLELERLTNPNNYYGFHRRINRRNRQHLRHVVRKFNRLTVVVKKQAHQSINELYPYITIK